MLIRYETSNHNSIMLTMSNIKLPIDKNSLEIYVMRDML